MAANPPQMDEKSVKLILKLMPYFSAPGKKSVLDGLIRGGQFKWKYGGKGEQKDDSKVDGRGLKPLWPEGS